MIKIDQTVIDKGIGNCAQAALASLFEKPLEETVNIIDHIHEGWAIPFMDWIESIGYEYIGTMAPADTKEESYRDLASIYAVGGFFYGCVPSRNFEGVTHAVIIDRKGVVVHDPHPEKAWLGENVVESGEIQYWYRFEPSQEAYFADSDS